MLKQTITAIAVVGALAFVAEPAFARGGGGGGFHGGGGGFHMGGGGFGGFRGGGMAFRGGNFGGGRFAMANVGGPRWAGGRWGGARMAAWGGGPRWGWAGNRWAGNRWGGARWAAWNGNRWNRWGWRGRWPLYGAAAFAAATPFWGWGSYWGDPYYSYASAYDDSSCYSWQRVGTPWGVQWQQVWVC